MASVAAASSAPGYRRHRPEQTALYAIVAEHYSRFLHAIQALGGHLPAFVRREFEDYLKCGLLEHGFLRVKCDGCRHEQLVAFSRPLLRIPAPAAFVIPFTSQAQGFLPELRRTSHSGVSRPSRRLRVSRSACSSVRADVSNALCASKQ